MTPTERLRKMLDERGVIWDGHCEPRHTWYDSPTMGRIIVFETQVGGLVIKPELMTPEQVIAATLPESDAGVGKEDGMNPILRLRELLDERGIKHFDHETQTNLREGMEAVKATSWSIDGIAYWTATPDPNGTFDVWVDHCMPEQAVFGVAMPDAGAFDEERYSKVCRLLEEALTLMSEWGT